MTIPFAAPHGFFRTLMQTVPRRRLFALLLALSVFAPLCQAQSFKAPIKIVVPAGPGGGTDVIARLVAPGVSRELGQTVFVENKPGASGQIAAQMVKAAPPDGAVVLIAVDTTLIVVPLTTPSARYDVFTDFVPLGQTARGHFALIVQGANTDIQSYVESLKLNPTQRTYGVSLTEGIPGVMGEVIGKYAGVQMVPVPFASPALAAHNLLGGHLPAAVLGTPEAIMLSQTGKVRVLGVSGSVRATILPDVPTLKELGIPGAEAHSFLGFFAPKALPSSMVDEFNAALRKSLSDTAVLQKIRGMGLEPAPTTRAEAMREVEELARFWKAKYSASK